MRKFLLVFLATYSVALGCSWIYAISGGGGILEASPAVLLGEPWIMIIGPMLEDKAQALELRNSAIDDDTFSNAELGGIAFSGMINLALIAGAVYLTGKAVERTVRLQS